MYIYRIYLLTDRKAYTRIRIASKENRDKKRVELSRSMETPRLNGG